MARRVYADFDSELHLSLAKRTDVSATQRGFFLNDAVVHVARLFVHPELEAEGTGTLASGTDNFTLQVSSVDLLWVDFVKDETNGRTLKMGQKDLIEDRTKRSGNPFQYYPFNNKYYVDRKPTSNLSMSGKGYKKPTEFSSGSPTLDQIYDPIIIMYAAVIGLNTLRDYDEATKHFGAATRYISEFKLPIREQKKDDQDTGIQVRFR